MRNVQRKEKNLCGEESGIIFKPSVFKETFAEVWLDDEWVKVEVLKRKGLSEGNYQVERIDGCGSTFEVKAWELEDFGLHDPESEHQIWEREEFEKLEKLLKHKGCTIEKIEGDGNCLFRAVARQIYGDQEQYQKVRDETVDHLIANKNNLRNLRWILTGSSPISEWTVPGAAI